MLIGAKAARLSAVLTLGLALITGCTSKEPADAGQIEAGQTEAVQTELTVLLDWYPNAVHTFLYAAEEQGYFEEAGLKVKLQTPADTNDAHQAGSDRESGSCP